MKRLFYGLFLAPCFLLLSACQKPLPASQQQILGLTSINSASIADNALIIGSLQNGAAVYTGNLKAPAFQWRMQATQNPPIEHITSSNKSSTAITSSGNTLALWDLNTGQALHYLSAPAPITAIAINTLGTLGIVGLSNNSALIIDLIKGGIRHTLNCQSAITSVAIWQDTLAITGEEANLATLWSLKNTSVIATQKHADGVTQVGFSPSGQLALSASRYDAIYLWQTQKEARVIDTISTKAKAMRAGKRLVAFEFLDEKNLLLGYSDRLVETRTIAKSAPNNQWQLSKKMLFSRDSTALISVGTQKNTPIAITSNGVLHTLAP